MYLRRDHLKRTVRAPSKLNLFLEIHGRRSDGFHELETLMVPIRLADTLSLTPTEAPSDGSLGELVLDVRFCGSLADQSRFEKDILSADANIVIKALKLLRVRSGCCAGAILELVKRVPTGAGLGGGSSDAAAALRLANRAWQIDWPDSRLAEIAAEIGSDVPFFLAGGPAICRGRGEKIEKVGPLRAMHFVIVKPPDNLSTADVYRAHDDLAHAPSQILAHHAYEKHHNPVTWMLNRLQAAAASLSPWVERLQAFFDRLDCLAHQLSGSGSAYFGICRHAQHARRLTQVLRMQQLGRVFATRSYP